MEIILLDEFELENFEFFASDKSAYDCFRTKCGMTFLWLHLNEIVGIAHIAPDSDVKLYSASDDFTNNVFDLIKYNKDHESN